MAATGVAFRSKLLRSLISPRARFAVPNPNLSLSSRINISSSRMEGCVSRFIRRELSTQQPFHSVIASACLVSKLPSDVTDSYEGNFHYLG
ncbi:hypothetical protein V5N11_014858 [Cardamine amara subsp. amara]|uniref:Uncharacterized protein n=1 Tax=Cardamine amara subsp. amara TaxID=228776 RepID=A0ABD1AD44_CARAN